MLLLLAAWAQDDPPDPPRSHVDVVVGVGLLQLPVHTYGDYTLAWPRWNGWATVGWELPIRARVRPYVAAHGASARYLWTGGRIPWESSSARLELRGGGRLDLVDRVTLDLTVGAGTAATLTGSVGNQRPSVALASTLSWSSLDGHLLFVFEGRLAPSYRAPDDPAHLYAPGGPGLLAGIGARY